VIWGSVYDDWGPSNSWDDVANKVINHMTTWNTREEPQENPFPNIVTLHDEGCPPPTAQHIKEIVDRVRQAGFPLANFDPNRAVDDRAKYKYKQAPRLAGR